MAGGPSIDWSRESRKTKTLFNQASDSQQPKITSFYEAVSGISKLLEESQLETLANASPVLKLPTSSSVPGTAFATSTSNIKELPVVLKIIIEISEQNYLRSPRGRRYDTVLKHFSTSLYLYAGPIAYEFVHANLNIGLGLYRVSFTKTTKLYQRVSSDLMNCAST